ncbi:MAG: ATP-dependent zinc protease [Bdellovibrionales bacterium]|nr:ATP-dependent zinc protease [Bdellovibrionales bacterium]
MSKRFLYLTLTVTAFLLFRGSGVAEQLSVEVPSENEQRPKEVIGWVEPLAILPEDIRIEAKISPSFTTSTLHADKIMVFRDGGKRHVRFSLEGRDGQISTIERPIPEDVSESAIKAKKIVVKMALCFGSEKFEVDVLLSDRSGFEQEARIARDTLSGRFLVDPSKTHTLRPSCSEQGAAR